MEQQQQAREVMQLIRWIGSRLRIPEISVQRIIVVNEDREYYAETKISTYIGGVEQQEVEIVEGGQQQQQKEQKEEEEQESDVDGEQRTEYLFPGWLRTGLWCAGLVSIFAAMVVLLVTCVESLADYIRASSDNEPSCDPPSLLSESQLAKSNNCDASTSAATEASKPQQQEEVKVKDLKSIFL